jgi:hypothetical protein
VCQIHLSRHDGYRLYCDHPAHGFCYQQRHLQGGNSSKERVSIKISSSNRSMKMVALIVRTRRKLVPQKRQSGWFRVRWSAGNEHDTKSFWICSDLTKLKALFKDLATMILTRLTSGGERGVNRSYNPKSVHDSRIRSTSRGLNSCGAWVCFMRG